MSRSDEEREAGLDRLARGFMSPRVERDTWYVVENAHCESTVIPSGLFTLPTDDATIGMYVNGNGPYTVETVHGWCARLSVDGYMDCTEWDGPYQTEAEAVDALLDMYDDGIDPDIDPDDADHDAAQ